jgi:hypothetical protein
MKQVWEYTIKPNELVHEVPAGGIIRCVDEQFGEVCAWIEVDPKAPKNKRRFEVYGTGQPINEDMGNQREYLGSVKLEGGALVFHVYEYTGI